MSKTESEYAIAKVAQFDKFSNIVTKISRFRLILFFSLERFVSVYYASTLCLDAFLRDGKSLG
jgi:hypothetical protein